MNKKRYLRKVLNTVVQDDCRNVLRKLPENSVHSIVIDSPYGLGFMGKEWDKFGMEKRTQVQKNSILAAGGQAAVRWEPNSFQEWCYTWAVEAFRVAKPGAYFLSFGGTRTFHRMACAIEDAGWVMKDTMLWVYGSGFPKSKNIALAIDKGKGHPNRGRAVPTASHLQNASTKHLTGNPVSPYEPKSEAAKQWDGFGTALKPSFEPILLFQKPLEGTYAENVLKWGCGALNIGGCRIGYQSETDKASATPQGKCTNKVGALAGGMQNTRERTAFERVTQKGRWPANFLLSHTELCKKVSEREGKGYRINRFTDGAKPFGGGAGHPYKSGKQCKELIEKWDCHPDCAVYMLNKQGGFTKTRPHGGDGKPLDTRGMGWGFKRMPSTIPDQGGVSRFFYCSKVSPKERNAGLEGLEDKLQHRVNPGGIENDPRWAPKISKNNHPTVKPINLLRYLCRLVTPPNGIVLDMFMGSGSTGCAAVLEGFKFIGIEKDKDYVNIATARIKHYEKDLKTPVVLTHG